MFALTRVLGLLVSAALLLPAAAAADDTCTRDSGPAPSRAPKLKAPIKLTPDRATELVNFGSGRGTKERDILILADKRLPKSIRPKHISLDLPRRFERVSETLESVELASPTFSEPVISGNRREIKFTICLDAEGIDAGSYLGVIRVGGPVGLAPASVSVTVNLRAGEKVFALALVVALLVAFFLLLFRRKKADEKADRAFFAQILVPLAAAGGAMYAVYAQDPAWGSDVVTAGAGLLGTALAAAGLKSLIDAQAGRKG